MQKLYSFNFDAGRMGSLHGLFVAEEAEVDAAIGTEVYFGEVLGKHSEVYGTLDPGDVAVKSDEPDLIAKLQTIFGGNDICGFNPLSYRREATEDED